MNNKFKLSKRKVLFSLAAVLVVGALLGGWLMRMPPEPRSNAAVQLEIYGALPTPFATNILSQIAKGQIHSSSPAYRLKHLHLREVSTQNVVNIQHSIEAAERLNLMQMRQYQQRVGGSLESPQAKLSNVRIQPNDVLLNITGASMGRITIAPSDMAGARLNQHVTIIRPTRNLHPTFLALFLTSPSAQRMINEIQVGATRQALTKGMIEQVEIPLSAVVAELTLNS